MKKNFIIKICLIVCFVLTATGNTWSQRMIRVSGTVFNIADKKKITPITDVEVLVYSCKTIAEAQKLKEDLSANLQTIAVMMDEETVTRTDKNGYYEILVPDNGALVFKTMMAEAVLVKVNNNQRIDVNIDMGHRLDEVLITGLRTELKPEPTVGTFLGNKLAVSNTFSLPPQTGSSFFRMIIRPYTVKCGTNKPDTVDFSRPIVIDGRKFHDAQVRKMLYDLKRDPLEEYRRTDIELTSDRMDIEWTDTITIPDVKANYSCYADFIIENLNSVEYEKCYQIVSCKNKRPLMFLDYDYTTQSMDFFSVYNREKAKVEKRNSSDRVSLSFEINSDRLVQTDENLKNMNSIKEKLNTIMNEPGATLKELYITGFASPDGVYSSNKALAQKRTNRIMDEVTDILPKSVNEMLYKMPDADVKPWSEVVELMMRDNLKSEAEEIGKIIDMYPSDMRKQNIKIKSLPYYKNTVTRYLEQLRQVEYRIKYDIYREPTDEEVMEAYREKGINGIYTRYEYWKLFQMIKDDMELETLALAAYNKSKEENPEKPWALAGNIVAVQYLKRDTCDVKLLEPLIDKTIYTCNYERKNIVSNRMELINPVEVVNNQLCMYIKANDYENASIMAKLLPEDGEYDLIKAYAWALGGYYRLNAGNGNEEKCRMTFDRICQSSKKNEVIMYLAQNSPAWNAKAESAIGELPADDALTWYFKAILSARKGDAGFSDTVMNLYQCFSLDKSFLHIAKNDGEFTDEVVEEAENLLMN